MTTQHKSAFAERFKPKKDFQRLRRLWTDAWTHRYETEFGDRFKVAAQLAKHTTELTPASDLEVLERYGYVRSCTGASVSVYVPETHSWAEHVYMEFPSPVRGLCSTQSFYAGGGGGPDGHVPPDLVPWFEKIVAAIKTHKTEDRGIETWVRKYREEHGKYPIWQEIIDQSPTLAQYLKQRALEEQPGA